MALQKLWDLVDLFTELDIISSQPEVLRRFEITLQPAFAFLEHSKDIEFEDSILKSMTFFINKEEGVSETMQILFPLIRNAYEKTHCINKELFDLIKAYAKHGRDFLLAEPSRVQDLFGYGTMTLHSGN